MMWTAPPPQCAQNGKKSLLAHFLSKQAQIFRIYTIWQCALFIFFQHLATSALSSSSARAPYSFTISRVISDSKQLKFSGYIQYDDALFSFFFQHLATSALSSSNARAPYGFTISRVISDSKQLKFSGYLQYDNVLLSFFKNI